MKFWVKIVIAFAVVVVLGFGVWAFFFREKDDVVAYNEITEMVDYKQSLSLKTKLDELRSMLTKLEEISHTINYLSRPIKEEGFLHKNRNGRYEINGHELSSGCGIECLITDDWHFKYDEDGRYVETPFWYASRIEHNGEDYYIVDVYDVELEGLKVRVR